MLVCVVQFERGSKYLSERFGARQMQIYSNGGPGTPFGGLVNQFEPFTYAIFPGIFPLLFFWQVHDALMGARTNTTVLVYPDSSRR